MKTHHLHRAETVLSRPSTRTKVEVEDVVQAKDKVVAVATKVKISNNSSPMMHRDQTHVDEVSPEAGGEVAQIFREISLEMITENAGVVVEQVTLSMTVHQEIRVAEGSKIIMRPPARIRMIQRGCL